MDFWVQTDEMKAWIKKERDYLLSINDYDALKLSHAEQYQRNKYKGEIESAKWLEEVRRKQAMKAPVTKEVRKKYKQSNDNWKVLGD
jgi:hypothetical protein